MARRAIGVDLGGTNIKAGAVAEDGALLSRVAIPTRGGDGHDAVVARIVRAAEMARAEARLPWSAVAAVGVGSPGAFEGADGVVHHSPNLKDMEGKPLLRTLRRAFGRPGLPVALENDANVAAYAESWVGVGRRCRHMVLFTLGTGIGGGLVLDGEIWRGAWGAAAELGHMNLFPDGIRCACGNRGCLEAYASAPALARRLRAAVAAGQPTVLAEAVRRRQAPDARDITLAARAGDRTCRALLTETGRYLGIAVMNVLSMLNVELVVFTGGLTAAGALLLDPIRREARRRTFALAFDRARILFSRMGNDAGVIGAAGWALHRQRALPRRRTP